MRSRQIAVLLTAVAMLTAACGGDRGEDTSAGLTPTTEAGSVTTGAPDDGGGGGEGDFGSLTGVCGPEEEGGDVPDAGPEETQGITDSSITLGTVADPGFTGRLGLNQEIFDAAEAFVEWCNAAGGINGKLLELNQHDAAITNYQPVVEEACATDFALVGAGAVQDNLWPEVGAACGLIDIAGFSVTPQKAGVVGQDLIALRSVQTVPNPGDRYTSGAFAILGEEHPDSIDATGFLTRTSRRPRPRTRRHARERRPSATRSSRPAPTPSSASRTGRRSRCACETPAWSSSTSSARARTWPSCSGRCSSSTTARR